MATVIPFPQQRSEHNLAHYRVEREIGEETGIRVCIYMEIAWPHNLLVTLAGTHEGVSTIAAMQAEEIGVAVFVANAALAALHTARVTWDLRQSRHVGQQS